MSLIGSPTGQVDRVGLVSALGLDPSVVEALVRDANGYGQVSKATYLQAVAQGCLPDPLRAEPLTWPEVVKSVPSWSGPLVERLSWDVVSSWPTDGLVEVESRAEPGVQEMVAWDVAADLAFKQLCPPRTNKDMSVRRSRFPDLLYHAVRTDKLAQLRAAVVALPVGADYIWACNVIVATFIVGVSWLSDLIECRAFEGDLTHYTDTCKCISNLVKTRGGVAAREWFELLEQGVLSGYRALPYEGFDEVTEAEKLANAGNEHSWFGLSFAEAAKVALRMAVRPVASMSLYDFVDSGQWLTAGSSSEGYLEVRLPNGDVKKVKARKNMVLDALGPIALWEGLTAHTGQQNYTLVKSELGKVRLAVAGDLYTYLLMAWINYHLGEAYGDWEGSTLGEDFLRTTSRIAETLLRIRGSYSLPWDYESMDHQLLRDEILSICWLLIAHAGFNIAATDQAMFNWASEVILNGFNHATLTVKIAQVVFAVLGGLQSGLGWTTILGNGWNVVVMRLVKWLLEALGVTISAAWLILRGDDTVVVHARWAMLALWERVLVAAGIRGGKGKFSILFGQTEFLRTWYGARTHGYPLRSIPALMQRKPWSNEPWTADMEIRALHETTRTLRRRCSDREAVDAFWETAALRWTAKAGLPRAALRVPKSRGGLGVEPEGPDTETISPIPLLLMSFHSLNAKLTIINVNL
jgi:hypothetical protein